MLLPITEVQKELIDRLQLFIQYCKQHGLDINIINTYNNPYLLTFIKADAQNLLLIKFNNVDGIMDSTCIGGTFYDSVNEYELYFDIYFLSFYKKLEYESYANCLDLYAYFGEFLYEKQQKFDKIIIKDNQTDCLQINFFIKPITNMQNAGKLEIASNYSKLCYSISQGFVVGVQIFESQIIKKEN